MGANSEDNVGNADAPVGEVEDIVIIAECVRYARGHGANTAKEILAWLVEDFPGAPIEQITRCVKDAADRLARQGGYHR